MHFSVVRVLDRSLPQRNQERAGYVRLYGCGSKPSGIFLGRLWSYLPPFLRFIGGTGNFWPTPISNSMWNLQLRCRRIRTYSIWSIWSLWNIMHLLFLQIYGFWNLKKWRKTEEVAKKWRSTWNLGLFGFLPWTTTTATLGLEHVQAMSQSLFKKSKKRSIWQS